MPVTADEVISEKAIRNVVQDALEENLQFRRFYRNMDISGRDSDTIHLPEDDDTMEEVTEIRPGQDFPMAEEDMSTKTATVKKYGRAVKLTDEAQDDAIFDIVRENVDKLARRMQEKLNTLAFNELSANLNSASPAGNVGNAELEFDDVIDARTTLEDAGYSPTIGVINTTAEQELLEYLGARATDMGDQTNRVGRIGSFADIDWYLANDGNMASGTAEAYIVDPTRYGWEVTKGGVETNMYRDESKQADIAQIWTRVTHKSVDSSAAIKIEG